MSMTGGISFYEKNIATIRNGASIAASTNDDDANYLLGTDRAYKWESVGSDDSTSETLIITLPFAQEFSRLFLVDMNFKDFSVQYGSGDDFANVNGLSGAKSDITETGYDLNTAYYEFDPVTTDTVIISIDTTQEVDAEKLLSKIILTNEIGTFNKFPTVRGFDFDRNDKSQKNAGGGQNILKRKETVELTIDMEHYSNEADIALIDTLFTRQSSFLVWPNGGKPSQFRRPVKGWTIKDIYLMQTTGQMPSQYYKNLYTSAVKKKIKLEEVDR